jgi:hypothetical protein
MPMRSSPGLAGCAAAVLILLAAPAAAEDGPDLQPAPQATIVAGAKACLGTTTDPASQATRFAGWAPATADQSKGLDNGPDGTVLQRDNVLVIYKTGVDGGCVVMAKGDASFNPAAFYPQISAAVGATVQAPIPGGQPTPIALPNSELIIPVVTPKTDSASPTIILVIGNSAAKDAKKEN